MSSITRRESRGGGNEIVRNLVVRCDGLPLIDDAPEGENTHRRNRFPQPRN